MAKDDLSLDIGDVLQLQFLGNESQERYYVKVIGYLHDRSLIVTTPHVDGRFLLVREGQRIAVRLLSGHNIMAFTVNVLRSCSRPYPYLHLSYPKELQAIMVRKAQRINFSCNGEIQSCAGGEVFPVSVEDISTSGALLVCEQRLGQLDDLLTLSLQLSVAGEVEELKMVCVIRNVRMRMLADNDSVYLHGVEFRFADRQESVMLHAAVYEQIVNSGAA